MKEYMQVLTTLERKEDAKRIARHLVEKRLAACAQVLGPISSTYWWEDAIEDEDEWLCIVKSTRDLFERIEKEIKGIHPYEEPEILAVPVIEGSRSYLEWVCDQVESE
ncbi:MAG: divalent-cation tolerance protein CutA [Deltaproteobacteria bacterium]|nr:divalent-cation tolerance protein CutA [Deltaproteobacteria bacterium]MBW2136868.1 divalent-cation tolerance protein CutA [Deltaproteobacteria bacterium]